MYTLVNPLKPIVQKYGGTSVGNVERIQNIAQRTITKYHEGFKKLVVVVSAMAGETNRFVKLIKAINPRCNGKPYDMAISAGEQVSVALTAAAIEQLGLNAEPFLAYQLGIFTDGFHASARIRAIDTQKIFKCWDDGIIPVIAGFQGVTAEMALTTLGRGGSDISAVALAVALDAGFCEINTDVDGVFTADPRIVNEARLIETLDYDTALELAALGSKVLHSRCVELGAKYKMPIVVRNSFKDDLTERTMIMNFSNSQTLEAPVVSGISLDLDVVKITIDELPNHADAIFKVFKIISQQNINVDIIVHNIDLHKDKQRLGFTINQADHLRALDVLPSLKGEKAFNSLVIDSTTDLAKVSAVGLGMRSYPGVASKVFEVLSANNIQILVISTSEIKISCVVQRQDGENAVKLLHQAFFTE